MKKQFIPYKQALKLKEFEFNEQCLYSYCIVTKWEKPTGKILIHNFDCNILENQLIKAPLWQQVFDWFREKHNLTGLIECGFMHEKNVYTFCIWDGYKDYCQYSYYNKFEEAKESCINELISILKNKKLNSSI